MYACGVYACIDMCVGIGVWYVYRRWLHTNSLSSLPDNVFDSLTSLRVLYVQAWGGRKYGVAQGGRGACMDMVMHMTISSVVGSGLVCRCSMAW